MTLGRLRMLMLTMVACQPSTHVSLASGELQGLACGVCVQQLER
jgi:hypothetical protein